MGGAAFATVVWFISADGLSEGAGQSLVDYANDHVGHLMGVDMAGFALITLGSLVLAAALIRARAVPVPAVVVYILLTLVQFAGLPGRAMDVLQIAMMVLLVGFAAVVGAAPGPGTNSGASAARSAVARTAKRLGLGFIGPSYHRPLEAHQPRARGELPAF